jgi:hypothetical protein
LAEPGYFNVIKAIDALLRDPMIKSTGVDGYGFPGVVFFDYWSVSDMSVADFTDKRPLSIDGQGNVITWDVRPNENDEVTIEALKPGKATVSYTPSMGHYMGTKYTVTLEITVLP